MASAAALRRALPWVAVAVALAAAWIIQDGLLMNRDVGWYLYGAGRLLDGDELYGATLFEPNPPLVYYLMLPVVGVARALGAAPIVILRLAVLVGAAVSAWLAARMLRAAGWGESRRVWWLAGYVLLALLVPARDFAQREHWMVLLTVPYVLGVAARAAGRSPGRTIGVAAGALAGVGLVLKPHALAVAAALEVFLLVRGRSVRVWLRADLFALAAFVGLYALSVLLLVPQYVEQVVPLARSLYSAYQVEPWRLIVESRLWLVLALPAALMMSDAAERIAGQVLALAAGGFWLSFLAQGKGWEYQEMPAVITAGLVLLGPALVAVDGRWATARPARRVGAVACLALLAAAGYFGAGRAVGLNPRTYVFSHERTIRDLLPYVRGEAAGGAIYAFTTAVGPSFPLVNYAGVRWASRFPCLWPLPALLREPDAEIEAWLRRAVVDDLLRDPPAVVLVEAGAEKLFLDDDEFEYLEYFAAEPRFGAFWSAYESAGRVRRYEVYCRRPCDPLAADRKPEQQSAGRRSTS